MLPGISNCRHHLLFLSWFSPPRTQNKHAKGEKNKTKKTKTQQPSDPVRSPLHLSLAPTLSVSTELTRRVQERGSLRTQVGFFTLPECVFSAGLFWACLPAAGQERPVFDVPFNSQTQKRDMKRAHGADKSNFSSVLLLLAVAVAQLRQENGCCFRPRVSEFTGFPSSGLRTQENRKIQKGKIQKGKKRLDYFTAQLLSFFCVTYDNPRSGVFAHSRILSCAVCTLPLCFL